MSKVVYLHTWRIKHPTGWLYQPEVYGPGHVWKYRTRADQFAANARKHRNTAGGRYAKRR